MKNSLRIHKWTHNEFNIFILGVLTHPPVDVIGVIFSLTTRQYAFWELICLYCLAYGLFLP